MIPSSSADASPIFFVDKSLDPFHPDGSFSMLTVLNGICFPIVIQTINHLRPTPPPFFGDLLFTGLPSCMLSFFSTPPS